MKFAILCPGESLHRTWPAIGKRRRYDKIIAISTAIDVDAPVDIWSAVDKINKRTRAKAVEKGAVRWENVKKTGFKKHSFFTAVRRAAEMGAKRIDIYGHDMEGMCNYDARTGKPMANSRGPKFWRNRWKNERATWQKMRNELAKQGVEVREVCSSDAR